MLTLRKQLNSWTDCGLSKSWGPGLDSLSSVSQENAATSEEVNASAEELASQFLLLNEKASNLGKIVDDLDSVLNQFRV